MKTAPLLVSLLFATPALAQQAAPPPPPPPAAPAAAPAAPAQATPAPAAATPATAAAPPAQADAVQAVPSDLPPPPAADPTSNAALSERISELEGKLEGMTESMQATTSTVSTLAKIKVSGYIQGRFVTREDSVSGVDGSGRVTGFDRFLVRRGRLKTTYASDNSEYMLQIDAVGEGVTLKDAEATFVDTWTPMGFRLTMGQFKVPFGYEVLQSSADREMPERARVIQALFPGERDRGVRLTGRYEWFKLMAALTNGNFTNDSVYVAFDQNRFRDLFLRLVGDFEFLSVGVSGEYGEKLPTQLGTPATVVDTNGTLTLTPAGAPTMRRFGLWRLGADAQFYYDIAGFGGLALKGEVVVAQDTHRSFRGAPADSCRDLKSYGWILTAVQNIGDHFGFAARLDQYDRNRDVSSGTSTTCMSAATAAANDKITTLGVGVLGYAAGGLKGSIVYEHMWRPEALASSMAGLAPASWVPTDQLTLQLQARF